MVVLLYLKEEFKMALCGWASIDERGKGQGGKAGDQKQTSSTNDTRGEVRLGDWYNFGQSLVIRYKDEKKAFKHAKALKSLCNNKHIGYDMNQRTTLKTELGKIGYSNYEKLNVDCETDCSALQGVCAKIAGAIDTVIATCMMKEVYGADDDFIILTDKKYLTSGDYLLPGDISVAPGHHTIGSIAAGNKSGNETRELTSKGCATRKTSPKPVNKKTTPNKTEKFVGVVTASTLNVRKGAGTNFDKCKTFGPLKKGTKISVCDSVTSKDKTTWYYIKVNGHYGFVSGKYVKKQ